MSSVAEISLWFLWLLVIVLFLLVLLLYRQWGLSLVRPWDRYSQGGIDIGARTPDLTEIVNAVDPESLAFCEEWLSTTDPTLAVFAIPNCPVCTELKTGIESLEWGQRWPERRLVLIEKVELEDTSGVLRTNGYLHIRLTDPEDTHFKRFDVRQAPFAYVLSPDRTVQAKGLVNTLEDLEALLNRPQDEAGEVHQHAEA